MKTRKKATTATPMSVTPAEAKGKRKPAAEAIDPEATEPSIMPRIWKLEVTPKMAPLRSSSTLLPIHA